MNQCKNCEYARYAYISESGNIVDKGMVACGYWSTYSEYTVDPETGDEVRIRPPKEYSMSENILSHVKLFEGWADLRRRPDGKESSGLMTNLCIILHGTKSCKMYKEIDK
jgi:hypothetical protein